MAGWRGLIPALPAVLIVTLGFFVPIASLATRAFAGGDGASAFGRFFGHAAYVRALLTSVVLSLVVASMAVVIALPIAVALARGRFWGRRLLRACFAVPLALSGVVIGFLAVAMLGNAGAVPTALGAPSLAGTAYATSGLLIAYLYFELPRAVLTMEASLGAIDDGLLEAARTLGATRWQVARLVFVPLCGPAMRAAFGVTFAASLGSFGVVLVTGARVSLLSLEIYRALTGFGDDALAAAMALVLGAVAASGLMLARRSW
jgi:putative spermidine/putrescine transport system permease protein